MNPWPVDARGGRGAPAAARPRRPRGRPEVRLHRRAQRARARQRARDRRARGRRRAGQGLPARRSAWRSAQPRDADRLGGRARARRPGAGGLRGRRRVAGALPRRRRRARRWSTRSTPPGRRTSRSAACSRCAPSGWCPGIGSHVSWEERLDGRLAQAIMSIQAMKGVGIGDGFDLAGRVGLAGPRRDLLVRGARLLPRDQPRRRARGRHDHRRPAGGARRDEAAAHADQAAALAWTSTTKEPAQALRERTDSCTVPAAGVVGEAMVALVLAAAYREKFGGDHIDDARAALARLRGADRVEARRSARRARLRRLHGRRQVHRRPHGGRRAGGRAARLRPRAGAPARRADRGVLRPRGRGRVPRARGGGGAASCSRAPDARVIALGGGALELRARARRAARPHRRAPRGRARRRLAPRLGQGPAAGARPGPLRAAARATARGLRGGGRRGRSRPRGRDALRRALPALRGARARRPPARGWSGPRPSRRLPGVLRPRADRLGLLPPARRPPLRGHRRERGAPAPRRGRGSGS